MPPDFDRRISRAAELAGKHPESAALLTFYERLAGFQKSVFEDLAAAGQADVKLLLPRFPALLELAEHAGPEGLASFAHENLREGAEREVLLRRYWDSEARTNLPGAEPATFFARALLQPFAEYLARRAPPDPSASGSACPLCAARPVVGVLRGEGEGAKRNLICSLCATEWPYRRLLCPNCGEEQKDRLPVYVAAEWPYIRVEACDACMTYIKSVDLTKDGRAVPVVDELASVTLAIWADERGYTKLETNILGM